MPYVVWTGWQASLHHLSTGTKAEPKFSFLIFSCSTLSDFMAQLSTDGSPITTITFAMRIKIFNFFMKYVIYIYIRLREIGLGGIYWIDLAQDRASGGLL
jgi:hypothetical protein